MRDVPHTDPKHMALHNELYDECKKALRQYWFSRDFKKAFGQKQWSVMAITEMCKNYKKMARHFFSVISSSFDGPIIPFGAEKFLSSIIKRPQSGAPVWHKRSLLEYSLDTL